jgi:indolepyruvate ferredoxin oxidoreductase
VLSESLDETVERRVKFLTAYQNTAYADRYRRLVEKAKAAEAARAPGKCGLADAVARYLFKLMAYKDEYEVARLYTDGSFRKQVESQFDGDNLRFEFHLAPPLVARRDQATGLPRKMSFGPWMLPAFRLLAKLKGLRGTPFDPFGRSVERRTERKLIADYEAMLDEILAKLTPENHHLAVGLAVIPEKIRGFGHVKQRHLAAAKADEAALLEQLRSGAPSVLKAAE